MCLLDKIVLSISETVEKNIMEYTDEELEHMLCVQVSYQEIRKQPVLAFLDSCRFKKVIFKMKDNVLDPTIEYLLSKGDEVMLEHTGVQGSNLLKVLCNLYPDKTSKLKHAALLNKDLMEVLA